MLPVLGVFCLREEGSTLKLPSLPSAVTFFNGAKASSEVMLDLNTSWNSTIILPRLRLSKEDYSNRHGINDINGNHSNHYSEDSSLDVSDSYNDNSIDIANANGNDNETIKGDSR